MVFHYLSPTLTTVQYSSTAVFWQEIGDTIQITDVKK